MTTGLAILLLASLLDRSVGDPDWLWRRMPHPVVLFGRVIEKADRLFNRPVLSPERRRRNGAVFIAVLVGAALLGGLLLSSVLRLFGPLGYAAEICLVAVFLAQKSLFDHVGAVRDALVTEGLAGGRRAVSLIVGRDVSSLDTSGVSRAAIESLAENQSDGVVAPWLAYLIGGLPGLLAYKAINTADSMIGHLSDRHRDFGRAAAKLDDVVNWPSARLTAVLYVASATIKGLAAWRLVWAVVTRDAPLHRSPNAGWPEAAMAAALGLSLGGPRRYGDLVVDAPSLNGEGRRSAGPAEIDQALSLTRLVFALLLAINAGLLALSVLL